jgi:protein gp37
MSTIQWTDETWNWLVGCSRTSPGCAHCYAADAAKSARLQQFPQYQAVKEWDGTVQFVESQLDKPMKRRKPTRYFTCSMSDVFHESVPFEWIDRAFAVMALTPWHTYQVLTKRPERMLQYFTEDFAAREVAIMDRLSEFKRSPGWSTWLQDAERFLPLPNVWLGTTVESQAMADKRIPLLIRTPAASRFLSCEPLLEEIYLELGRPRFFGDYPATLPDWVIIGGESGPKARPCQIDWIRSLVQQCRAAGVAPFVKQLGELSVERAKITSFDGIERDPTGLIPTPGIRDRKGGNIDEWPEDLRVREFPVGANP